MSKNEKLLETRINRWRGQDLESEEEEYTVLLCEAEVELIRLREELSFARHETQCKEDSKDELKAMLRGRSEELETCEKDRGELRERAAEFEKAFKSEEHERVNNHNIACINARAAEKHSQRAEDWKNACSAQVYAALAMQKHFDGEIGLPEAEEARNSATALLEIAHRTELGFGEKTPNPATLAFDEIAKICGCAEWDYPGQIVRDVQFLKSDRDELARQLAEIESTPANVGVLVSPAMGMQVAELKQWLDHHGLGLSVGFEKRVYSAELRKPLGSGGSVLAMDAKAADFDVAVITACQNYERIHVQRTD